MLKIDDEEGSTPITENQITIARSKTKKNKM